jgi:hypothetical protein
MQRIPGRKSIRVMAGVCSLAAALAVIGAAPSMAQGRGGGAGGMGGNSAPHVSSPGVANSNGPNSPDRDKGQARAQDRMSVQGADHNKASDADKKKK